VPGRPPCCEVYSLQCVTALQRFRTALPPLSHGEKAIEPLQETDFDIGRILRQVLERKLYRELGVESFERYAEERLDLSPRTARRLERLARAEHLARLDEPMLALEALRGLVVLDEVQARPELFPVLRVLADRPGRPARFLVLGSASPDLLRQSSETLAGRIGFHHLPGFDLEEVGTEVLDRLWFRGGFPRSYLARSHRESFCGADRSPT